MGTGLALGTAGEEEVVVVEVVVEEVVEVELGQEVEIPQCQRLEREAPVAGWENAPLVPASVRSGKLGGSWEP